MVGYPFCVDLQRCAWTTGEMMVLSLRPYVKNARRPFRMVKTVRR